MKIGFDLDKIFVDYPPLIPDALIDRLYKKKANGQLLYRIPSRPEQFIRKLSHYHRLRPPIKENIDFLHSLRKNNYQLFLVSSRFGFLEKHTLELMRNLGLAKLFDGVYFNFENKQPHLFKDEILTKLKLDMYVDDDLHLLRYVAKDHTKTKFFWLNSSDKKQALPREITRIYSLQEMFHDSH